MIEDIFIGTRQGVGTFKSLDKCLEMSRIEEPSLLGSIEEGIGPFVLNIPRGIIYCKFLQLGYNTIMSKVLGFGDRFFIYFIYIFIIIVLEIGNL